MNKRMKAAFGCHFLAILLIGIVGVIYLLRTEFMPYHAIAVERSWDQVDPAFKILIIALIRVFGGVSISTAFAMGVLLFIPFRQGMRWAYWSIPAIGIVAETGTLFGTLYVIRNTPARPPWQGIAFTMVLLVVGFLLSMQSEQVRTRSI